MDQNLLAALNLLLRDLRSTGAPEPELAEMPAGIRGSADSQSWAWMMSRSGGASALGVGIVAADDFPEQVTQVASAVQDWVVEELWAAGASTNWPPCPVHPGRHPVEARLVRSAAVWVCPSGGPFEEPIGALRVP